MQYLSSVGYPLLETRVRTLEAEDADVAETQFTLGVAGAMSAEEAEVLREGILNATRAPGAGRVESGEKNAEVAR